jgi:hypothetical protein
MPFTNSKEPQHFCKIAKNLIDQIKVLFEIASQFVKEKSALGSCQ